MEKAPGFYPGNVGSIPARGAILLNRGVFMTQASKFNLNSSDAFTLEDRVKLIRKYVHDSIPLEMDGWRIIGGDRVSREARFKAVVDYPGNSNSATDIVKDELLNVIRSMLYGIPSAHLIDIVSENNLNYYSALLNIYSDIRYKYWDMSPVNASSYNLMDLDLFLNSDNIIQVPMLSLDFSSDYNDQFDPIGWGTDYKEIVIDKYIRVLPFTLVEFLRSGYPVSTVVNSISDDITNHINNFILQTSVAYSNDITDIPVADFDWQALAQLGNKSEKHAAQFEKYNNSGDLVPLMNYMDGVKESEMESEIFNDDYDEEDCDYEVAMSTRPNTNRRGYSRFLSNLFASIYVNENRANEFLAKLNLPDELLQNITESDILELMPTYKAVDNDELAIIFDNDNKKSKSRSRLGRKRLRRVSRFAEEEMSSEYYYPRTVDKMFMLENDGQLAYGSMLGIDTQHKTTGVFRLIG